MPKTAFESSKELKVLFNEHFARWKKKHHAGLEELAGLCGVTPSYLGHVGRYGRVPGRPVLILLAFNFELENPQVFFDAAGIQDPWPYESGLRLRPHSESDPGFLSLRLDMTGFTQAIREIVRSEVKPRSVRELTRGRPLRVGFNLNQSWFFDKGRSLTENKFNGFFPELFHVLSLSLHSRCEISAVGYLECFDKLASGELDIYGPLYSTPARIGKALYLQPFCRVGVAALWRTRKAQGLENLPRPESLDDLRQKKYQISVLRESNSHHFALSHLEDSQSTLVVSENPDEALERITLANIPRPAHLMLVDSLIAIHIHRQHPHEYELLFSDLDSSLGVFENTIAVRPDWPELVTVLNDAMSFLIRENTLVELSNRRLNSDYRGAIQVISSAKH